MATFQAIFVPATPTPTKSAGLGGTTSTAEIVFNNNAIIAVQATGNCQIRFGNAGMAAADNTAWFIPSGATQEFDLGSAYDRVRIFNPGASAIDVYIMQLSRN